MRPDLVFSDSSVSPSFFFTTPAKKPRTECGCQPVTFEIAAMVVPPLAWSRPRTRSCFVVLPLDRDAVCVRFFVFALSCFAGLLRGLSVVLNLAMKDLRGGATPSSHHLDPAQVNHPRGPVLGAATAPPASPATLRSQQKSRPTSSNLVARLHSRPLAGGEWTRHRADGLSAFDAVAVINKMCICTTM